MSKPSCRKILAGARFQQTHGRLTEIERLLSKTNANAVICETSLDKWYKQKAIECSSDIQRMSRDDLVWSLAVAYAIEAAVIAAERAGNLLARIDVFHDPKSLTQVHQEKLHSLLHRDLSKMFRNHFKRVRGLRRVQIERIEAVTKTGPENFLRRGVWLSDQILKSTNPGCRFDPTSPIQRMDITKYMDKVVASWGRIGPMRQAPVVETIGLLRAQTQQFFPMG